ncbi:MAG TPA: hypothetical protein VNS46_05090 [Nocardioides sp.]|nr:hypothetical protein [Nocardioides sp.]
MVDDDDYNFEGDNSFSGGHFQVQPPTVLYPADPKGYGEEHPPPGGWGELAMAPRRLIEAAHHFDAEASDLATARELIAVGYGKPWIFGAADTLYTAGGIHQDINEVLYRATQDGQYILGQIANGLVETANDTVGTDQTAGANFKNLDIH